MRAIHDFRKLAVALAATGLAAGAVLAGNSAQAAPTATPEPTTAATANPNRAAAASAGALASRLGARSAGSYQDASGKQVVTVTDASAAAQVRATGAKAKLVKYGASDLAAVTTALESSAHNISGTAWGVDPATNRVVVSVDKTVTGAKLAKVKAAAATFGDRARIQVVAGTYKPAISGGDAIYGGAYRCSLGFNVQAGGTGYFLTAGHCGNIAASWYGDGAHSWWLGDVWGSSFPGNDYALVSHAGGATRNSDVNLYNGTYQPISAVGDAYVGEWVNRSGSTTGLHSGTVLATGVTVNYAEGSVYNTVQTNICVEGGDSGGALFDGGWGLGLTSGGSGDCSSGGQSFYQPLGAAMNAFGVTL